MKKLLLATLIGGLTLNTAFAGPALPTVYGKLDVSLDGINADQKYNTYKVDSNNSLFGLKGDEKLTDALSIFYLIEWTINTDGDGTDLGQRNRYVGLKHETLGSVKLGKFDSYIKRLGGQDLFDNYAANTVDIAGTLTGENRINNTVSYETPTFKTQAGDLQWNLLLAQGERQTKAGADLQVISGSGGVQAAGNHVADGVSTSITYKNKVGITAGLGYDHAIPSTWLGIGNPVNPGTSNNALVSTDIVRAVATYDIKSVGLSLRALVQRAEVDKASSAIGTLNTPALANTIAKFNRVDDETGFVLGAAYKIPSYEKFTVKAQYNQATTSFKSVDSDFDVEQIALGLDYAFNTKTRAYGYIAQNTKEQGSLKIDTNTGGLGLEYKF